MRFVTYVFYRVVYKPCLTPCCLTHIKTLEELKTSWNSKTNMPRHLKVSRLNGETQPLYHQPSNKKSQVLWKDSVTSSCPKAVGFSLFCSRNNALVLTRFHIVFLNLNLILKTILLELILLGIFEVVSKVALKRLELFIASSLCSEVHSLYFIALTNDLN